MSDLVAFLRARPGRKTYHGSRPPKFKGGFWVSTGRVDRKGREIWVRAWTPPAAR